MLKPEYFLEKCGIVLDHHDSAEEKMRQMIDAFGVHESYEGKAPYIFVSYAHKDSALVLPAIKAIQEKGYPVWFDAGITPGSEWAADISRHLKNASLVLAFVSESAFASNNCRAEIVYAFGHKKPMLTVRLDNTPLPDGLDMQLSLSQMFDAFAYDDGDEFLRRLAGASILAQKIQPVLLQDYARERRQAEETERLLREQEEAARRAQAEEAKRAAEKAERERLEAEEAQRKYQQAKEEARKRREAEEAQQKLVRVYSFVEQALEEKTMAGYKKAIDTFNNTVLPMEYDGLEEKRRVAFLRDRLVDRIYREAEMMERNGKTRVNAGFLYRALPDSHRDAAFRGNRLKKQYAKRETVWGILLSVFYLGAHVALSRFVLHLVPWYVDILLMLLPMLLVSGLVLLESKVFHGRMDNFLALLLFVVLLPCVIDPFLFQSVAIWARVLWSLCYTVLNVALWIGAMHLSVLYEVRELPKVK